MQTTASVHMFAALTGLWLLLSTTQASGRSLQNDISRNGILTEQNPASEDVADGQTRAEKSAVQAIMASMKVRSMHMHGIKTNGNTKFSDYLYQGDIVLTPEDANKLYDAMLPRQKRKLSEDRSRLWSLPIPYVLDTTFDASEKRLIQSVLSFWQSNTCIRFAQLQNPKEKGHTVFFTKNEGCWSYIGKEKKTDLQKVSFGDRCFQFSTISHEVGHLIGFWHEHSRPDRNQHVVIHYENIKEEKLYNFRVESWGNIRTLSVPYDITSIMHYRPKTYSSNNKNTIDTLDSNLQKAIGQSHLPSFYDIKLANLAYCDDKCKNSVVLGRCLHDGYPDPANCSQCRCTEGLSGTTCSLPGPSLGDLCGGIINATTIFTYIHSPGYPERYRSRQQCNWLIQAPEGENVYLEFVGNFNTVCRGDVCRDYVELRYFNNLATPGARFCCGVKANGTFVSLGNQMLVLFRSFGAGPVGFKVRITTESCGGCGLRLPAQQKACKRRVSYICAKSWSVRFRIFCSGWWNIGCTGGFRYKKMVRYSTCFREESYCCTGFKLENKRCIAIRQREEKSTTALLHKWSLWSDWSACSRPCGACGIQSRSRTCPEIGGCGKQSSRRHTKQTRECNRNICSHPFVQRCQKKIFVPYLCSVWSKKPCFKGKTKTVACSSFCCKGHKRDGNVCVKRRKG